MENKMIDVKEIKLNLRMSNSMEIAGCHVLSRETYNEVLNAIAELERLQKKEVPMKLIYERAYIQLIQGACYECGNCHHKTLFSGYKYCPECGIEIDWGEENERT